ncbi:hypothetical protein D9M69_461780 [compost metagenome]
MYMLQKACEIQVRAQSTGATLTEIPKAVEDKTLALTRQMNQSMQGREKMLNGTAPWPALLRRLDRLNPGYQD